MTTLTHVDVPARPRARGRGVLAATGWALTILALATLGYELLLAATGGGYHAIAAGEFWYELDVASLNLVQAVIQRYVHPWLWDPVLASVLRWPLWSLLGGPGVALVILAGRRAG